MFVYEDIASKAVQWDVNCNVKTTESDPALLVVLALPTFHRLSGPTLLRVGLLTWTPIRLASRRGVPHHGWSFS